MPYTNVPPEMQDKFDRCVEKVMATGKDKEAAIAICYTSLVEGKARTDPGCCDDDPATGIMGMLKALGDAIQSALGANKAGARHSKADNEMIQAVHDNAVQLGAMCKGMRDCKSSFVVMKDSTGGYRWLGVVSNNYTDLDGEVLTDAAHKDFIAFLDQHPDQAPEWWTWHVDVGRKARADVWDYDGHFLWMSGPATAEQAAPYIAQDIGPRGMSHGFRARKEGEAITLYRTFEVSDLPLDKAANSWTAFEVVSKEAQMAFTPDKRADLVKLFGEEKVQTLEESSEATAKALDAAGVSFKAAKAEMPPAPEVEVEVEEPEVAPAPQSAAMDMAPHMEALAGIAGKLAELQAAIAAIVQTMGAPSEMAAEREAAKKDRAMLSTIAAQVAEQGEQIKALQRTDDEKVAAVLQPRTAPFARGVRATEAAPVVTEKDATQIVRENQFSWVKTIGPLT